VDADYSIARGAGTVFHDGIPLLKPPYAHLTAIDLNKGEIVWRVRSAMTHASARIPRSKTWPCRKTRRPRLGGRGRDQGGLIFVGGGDTALHAASTAMAATSGNPKWPSRQLDPHDLPHRRRPPDCSGRSGVGPGPA